GAGRGGRARWGGRRFGGDRFGHRGPVDLQDGRVHRSAVDAVEFVGGADQVPADAVRATRGGRDGEHDHLHAVDLGFLDGLGQVVVAGDEEEDVGGAVTGVGHQVEADAQVDALLFAVHTETAEPELD